MSAEPHRFGGRIGLPGWWGKFRPCAANELIELPAAVLDALLAGLVGGYMS